MFVVQPGRPEHDHELTFARVHGFHIDPENSRAGRSLHAEHFRLRRATFESNLHVAFSERLEVIQAREVNGEA